MGANWIRGVDEPLPGGERLLWQGSPEARVLARRAFRVRWVAGYFLVLAGVAALAGGPGSALARVSWLLLLGAVATGMVAGYAWLVERTTVYALTDRRVLMRVGVAFPSVFNLPLPLVGEAYQRRNRDGSGDVALEIRGSERVGYAFLWPHTRPWRFAEPQPMLRGLAEVEPVAELLRNATMAAREGAELPTGKRPVIYSVMDDDGIEILSNQRPPREPLRA